MILRFNKSNFLSLGLYALRSFKYAHPHAEYARPSDPDNWLPIQGLEYFPDREFWVRAPGLAVKTAERKLREKCINYEQQENEA